MGPRDGLGWCEKCRPPRVFDPRTVQPVANCHTDYAVPENGNYASRKPVFIGKKNSGLVKTERKLRLSCLLTHGKNLARELKGKGSICGKGFNFNCYILYNIVPCSNCWWSLYLSDYCLQITCRVFSWSVVMGIHNSYCSKNKLLVHMYVVKTQLYSLYYVYYNYGTTTCFGHQCWPSSGCT